MTSYKINSEGKNIIKLFEGCRLKSYQDLGGVWTIGFGSTQGVTPDLKITAQEAVSRLESDLVRFEKGVNYFVKAPINLNQFSALVSLAYNIGLLALSRSQLLNHVNLKEFELASQHFIDFDHVNGQEIEGLKRRRLAERTLFLKPL